MTMKNAASIFFLTLMLSIQTPVGQLFKFPLFIEHFIKHQKQEGVSLLGFLAEHYATDHNDADLPEDEQLPFKNIAVHAIGYAIVTPVIQTTVFIPLPDGKKLTCPGTYIPQQHLASIFHPPRA